MSVFSLIIAGKIPAVRVFENERFIVIEDIHPQAPIHLLIIPKKMIANLQSMEKEDFSLLAEVVEIAQQIALKKGIAEGYRLVTNSGSLAGQTIFHLHFHLIGGKQLGSMA